MIRAVTVCVVLLMSLEIFAQEEATPLDSPTPQGEITEAFHVTYPPMAVAARVSGDVILKMHIGANGKPGDITVVSGPAMLRDVAIESGRKSTYLCRSCTESGASIDLTYSFKLVPAIGCAEGDVDHSYPRFTRSDGTITIEAQPVGICDPAADVTTVRARSAKCLFLWRCGWR